MNAISLNRTTSEDPDFIKLVALLDAELSIRDGEDHAFYDQFNKIAGLRHVIVARNEDGRAVACGAVKPYDHTRMEVKRMFVLPEERGRGVAGKVLRELEKWAQELGYPACILETGINQPEAIALYRKSGYSQIENYGQYAGVETSLCFEKHVV